MLSITKKLKMLMLEKDMKQIEVAEKLGYTKQGFNKLLSKDDYKLKDIEKIADILGYEVELTFIEK